VLVADSKVWIAAFMGAIDVLVAICCLESDYALLHGDFDAFKIFRGLRGWRH
jgi:hypothetical protein